MFKDFIQQLRYTHHLSDEEETKETGTWVCVALNIHRRFSWCNHKMMPGACSKKKKRTVKNILNQERCRKDVIIASLPIVKVYTIYAMTLTLVKAKLTSGKLVISGKLCFYK